MEHRNKQKPLSHLISIPFIYLVLLPLLLLDACMELYHRLCFPLFNIAYVKRSDYIRIDRHKLRYLHLGERVNCAYCGYANGLFAYAAEIAARTEAYWCGIQHQARPGMHTQPHQKHFLPYGDENAFRKYFSR